MGYAVQTQGLTKRYGTTAVVNNVALAVPQGSVYGFLGPNGAGKTTTMKCLLGLIHPTEGAIAMLGQKVTPRSRLKVLAHVGSLIEGPCGYPHLTAKENLSIVARLRGLSEKDVQEALAIVRLDGAATERKKIREYSLGMRQRLGIASALLGRPPLLLLDEPTNGLDPAGIHEIRELIRELPSRLGTTVVVSSHLLSEVEQIADHVGIIARGSMVWQGSLTDLRSQAQNWLTLRTTNDAEAARFLPGAVADPAGGLRLSMLGDAALGSLTKDLALRGVGIVRLEEHAEGLEDIFLSLTRGEATL